FALDGRDIGAEIIGEAPGMAEYRAELDRMAKAIAENRVPVSLRRPARWEAENGAVRHTFKIGEDPGAFGGKFVWMPGMPGGRGGHSAGMASWQLDVQQAGTYKLWGRIWAPTPDDDSFFVSANAGTFAPDRKSRGPVVLEKTEWHTGVTGGQWKWRPFPAEIALPAGPVVLSVHVREDGTKIDRLFLSADLSQEPAD
ncbi:MAG: hypothetical protein IJ658_05575, partial [Kiritimatiellae bacterium]|nr:hypothetical protein [Kiritimatiellia bacterium]